MRAFVLALAVAGGTVAIAAPSPALAWYDYWGRWHPNHYHRYYAPPRYYSYAPRPYYRRYYAPPRYYSYAPPRPYHPPPSVYYRAY